MSRENLNLSRTPESRSSSPLDPRTDVDGLREAIDARENVTLQQLQENETLYRIEIERLREQLQRMQHPSNPNPAPSRPENPNHQQRMEHKPNGNMRFDDIIKTFKKFKGDCHLNIFTWLRNFKEQSEVFHLSPLEKFVYAKRLMDGTAKSFVEFESTAINFVQLEAELIEEYGKSVNSALIHQKLQERKKKKDETPTQYLYEMLSIAAQTDIDTAAIITHTINGLPGPSSLKCHMYEAKDLRSFKDKLLAYEIQYAMTKNDQKKGDPDNRRNKEKSINGTRQPRCYNCGDTSHDTPSCPSKDKGPKCFRCNLFGHTGPSCVNPPSKRRINMINTNENKVRKQILINDKDTCALFDTGSDYTVIREDSIAKKKIRCEIEPFNEEVKGVGGMTNFLGRFKAQIQIDDDVHEIYCHIMSENDIDDEAIIGYDLIKLCEMKLTPEKLTLKKIETPNDIHTRAFDELCAINFISEEENRMADLSHLSKDKQNEVFHLITNYSPKSERECPIEMEIVLQDEVPVNTKPRRLSPCEKVELDKQVKQWLSDGVIRESFSDYAAQALFKPKKDGSKRLCVDYRRLNKKIIRDRFPVPNLEDQLDQLQKGTVFTTLDLKNGYHHVPIKENSKKYTAFVTPTGQYEFNKVPFGLSSSPSVFCRFIQIIFRKLIAQGLVVTYMDDIIIIANNDDEAIKRLEIVLNQAASYNLNINWKKCDFLKRNIEVFGNEIENGTIKSSSSKIKAVNKYPEPKNIKELQRFLGFANYFRKFIDNYAFLAKPLTDLTKKDIKFKLGDEEKNAFQTLKSKIVERPVLMIYQPNAETQLHTDASKFATAAILMQRNPEDNEFHPVLFMSKVTTKDQQKWFSYELEMYAIFLAITKWRNYLIDLKFTVITDCEALKTAMNKQEVRKISNWIMTLQSFDFTIAHRPGSKMLHVDALSRIHYIQSASISHQLRKAQKDDEFVSSIIKTLTEKPVDDYVMHNGLLCKFADSLYQIVVPDAMAFSIISKVHQDGHFKHQKLESLIKKEFFIQNLSRKIDAVITNCIECILCNKKGGKKEGFLHPINKDPIPLDTFHMDHLGPMPSTNKNYAHILAVIDSFTKFTWLFPTKSTTTEETLSKLKLITDTFGNPRRIITDKGTAFTSNAFQQLCQKEDIELIHCTTGVPRGNGQIERIHRIVIGSLSKLSMEDPEKWFAHVTDVQKSLNSTHQRAINTTPFELMVGTRMRGNDLRVQQIIEEEIAEDFIEERNELRMKAKEEILKIQDENRETFNKKRKTAKNYNVDDLVAISKTQFSTGSKLKTKNVGPYKVSRVKENDRYEVEKLEGNEGPKKTSTSADNMIPWASINMIQRAQHQPSNHSGCTTIFIEGNIGAGKSTLVNALREFSFIKIHEEPVNKWQNLNGFNLLNLSYENPRKYSFMFQSHVLLTMTQRHLALDTSKINVMERSAFTAKECFIKAQIENNTIEQPFVEVFNEWFDFIRNHFPIEPRFIIYLKTNPDNLLKRIEQRGRPEEQSIKPKLLQQLHRLHENYITKMKNKCKILEINADEKINEETLSQILNFVKEAGGVE